MHGNLERVSMCGEGGVERNPSRNVSLRSGLYVQAKTDRRPTTSWVAGVKMGCPYDWVNGKHQGNTTKATSKNAIYKKIKI